MKLLYIILLVLSIVTALCCLGILAYVETDPKSEKGYWIVSGNSAQRVLFDTSCISFAVCLLLIITQDDAETKFFTLTNLVIACFYLASGIAAIIHSTDADFHMIELKRHLATAGAAVGIFAAVLHGITFILTIRKVVKKRNENQRSEKEITKDQIPLKEEPC